MRIVELTGRINQQGQLEFSSPLNLPPGEVRVVIQTLDSEVQAADEALWDAQPANSPDILDMLAGEANAQFMDEAADEHNLPTEP